MIRDLFRAPWLLDPRTFGGDDSGSGGGGGDSGGGGGSSDSGSSSQATEKQTIGQVSSTGQYAGDGFEWVENEGGYLTRTYTGEGKDNGLGTDVRTGGTEDKPVKEAIAQISLDQKNKPETVFGETKASSTDGSLLDLFRAPEDQVGSASYAEQIGYQAPKKEQTFDEAFAENRAAGNKTFTWNGNQYTTDLAPEPEPEPEPEPTPLTDAEKEAALFEQPVIQGESDLPDTVSDDFFDQFATPSIDYTVSQGEAGRGGPDSAAPTFTYEPGVDPVKEALVNLKNTSPEVLTTSERLIANEYEREMAEQPTATGGVEVAQTPTATDVSPDLTFTNPRIGYESGQDVLQASPDFLTGLDGSGPNTVGGVSDAYYGGTGADVSPAYAIEQAEEDANKSLVNIGATDIVPGLVAQGAEQELSAALETARDLNLPMSGAEYITDPMYKYRAAGLGDMSGLDRLAQEQYTFTTGNREEVGPAALRLPSEKTAAERLLQNIADREFGEAQENISRLSPETLDAVTRNAVTIPGKFGYGEGQVDPAFAGPLGEDPNKLNLAGIEVDPKATLYQTALTGPAYAATLGAALVNPKLGATLGATMAGGEGQREARQEISDALKSGALQSTTQYQQLLNAINASPELGSLSQADKDARIVNQLENDVSKGLIPLNFLAGAVSAATPGMLKTGPGAIASVPIEAAEESLGETSITNAALLSGTGLEKTMDPSQLASEAAVAGLTSVGPAVTSTFVRPTAPDQYTPPAATTGKIATDPAGVTSAYEAAETQLRSEIAPDNVTVAEQLMLQQLEDEGAIDVTELDGLNLTLNEVEEIANRVISKKMDSDAFMLQALAEESVNQTGGISSELVEEMNQKLNPEVVAKVIDDAFNNPFISNIGETRVDMALRRPPSGIEEAMLPSVPEITTPDLSRVPSRLNLTDAQPVESQPDLSGITSNLNLSLPQTPAIPADPETTVIQKNGVATTYGDAVANETVTATQQLENARITGEYTPAGATFEEQLANMDQDIKNLADQLVSENYTMSDAITSKMDADAAAPADTNYQNALNLVNEKGKVSASFVQRQLGIGYQQANNIVQRMEDEGLISKPNHVGKRTVNTEAVAAAALPVQEEEAAAEVEVAETTEAPVFTSTRSEPVTDVEPVFSTVRETQTGATVELPAQSTQQTEGSTAIATESTQQTEPSTTVTTEPSTTVTTEPTTTVEGSTTVDVPFEPEEEEEPIVEETPVVGDPDAAVTVEVDEPDGDFVAPITTTDDDGNEITECPEGYQLVEGPDGPTCQKSVQRTRQRAGRGLQAYTNLALRAGETGPGQKKKTTTVTQRTAPITRRT